MSTWCDELEHLPEPLRGAFQSLLVVAHAVPALGITDPRVWQAIETVEAALDRARRATGGRPV